MKISKLFAVSLLGLSIITCNAAKNVEYFEDAYFTQAPQALIEKAQKAAQLVGYQGDYQLMQPKKAALEMNPWHQFLAHGINPANQKPMIIVNQPWFSKLSVEQQDYLLARCFSFSMDGQLPTSAKVLPFIFMFLGIIIILAIFWLINQTALVTKPKWMRIILALILATIFNQGVTNPVMLKLLNYLNTQHDIAVSLKALEKTGNGDAALGAFENYKKAIKEHLDNGQTFWTPFEHVFDAHIERLKR